MAILVACGAFAFHDIRVMQTARVAQLRTQAEMLAFNSLGVLLFEQKDAADDLLQSVSRTPDILQAALFTADQRPLASYLREDNAATSAVSQLPELGDRDYRFSDGERLELVYPVLDESEVLGTLYLQVSTEALSQQMANYLSIALVVATISLLVASSLAFVLQSGIARPIHQLADVSRRISRDGDYSLRVQGRPGGEIGTLNDAFNHMLDQIESWKKVVRETNEDLREARDAAEAANEAKSRWLANMSHEIRTPLNAILGFTQLLRNGADKGNEAERREFLETIHSSGQHLLQLVNDILDISKIEADRMVMEKAPCSPHDVLSEVISVLQVRATEKDLTLKYDFRGQVPGSIVTDAARLRQIVINLVGNAIKFTESGGVHMEAWIESVADESQLAVRVTDSGIGIPEEQLESIFEAFQQADGSVTRRFGGTGLGLSISHRMAELLGYTLTVESTLGEGSSFILRIAAGTVEKALSRELPVSDSTQERQKSAGDKPDEINARVLVVDDGEINRKFVRFVLEKMGVSVAVATNGEEGIEAATKNDFDLVLMDMQMPIKDGYTATKELRQAGYATPIIALTANAMQGDRKKCLDAGCDNYLSKPVDPQQLTETVAAAIARKESRTLLATSAAASY
ncbi:MAG: response regulator [Planctomycetota bacterium]